MVASFLLGRNAWFYFGLKDSSFAIFFAAVLVVCF